MALWRYTIDTTRMALTLEFMALAVHRKALREAMAEHGGGSHAQQLAVIERALGDKAKDISPVVVATMIAALGRSLVMEAGVGVDDGHEETRGWFEKLLKDLSQ